MTSAQEFRKYLRVEGLYSLAKIQVNLKNISFTQAAKWDGIKLSLSHYLNTLYYEMFDFKLGLEQEMKTKKDPLRRFLLDDLEKEMKIVLAFREEVLTTRSFTNKALFELTQQRFLLRIKKLNKVLRDYVENLQIFEQKLMNA